MRKISDKFDFRPDRTLDYGVRVLMGKCCLHASSSFLIESSSKLLVTRAGIKAWMSLISGRIRLLTLDH